MGLKTGLKLVPKRVFDAEAFRKPLESLLERSWRHQEPNSRGWERLLAELGQKRVPKWEQKMGAESGPRCLQEPKRLPESYFGSISGCFLV